MTEPRALDGRREAPSANLLLLSNSVGADGYLAHALDAIRTWWALGEAPGEAVFVPFAGVVRDWDAYAELVAGALERLGIPLRPLHRAADMQALLAGATHVVVGGGNTFHLLYELRRRGLLAPLADRVRQGHCSYLGWSAGANLACPTIRTTNDMPVVDPGGFDALAAVPFQINPHFTQVHPSGHRGETRLQRLQEFCALNPDVPVWALPEGTGLHVGAQGMRVLGGPVFLLAGDGDLRQVPEGPVAATVAARR